MDTPGSVGGMDELMARIAATKKVARLDGGDEKGVKSHTLPDWFTRTGVRTFTVDSGIGVIKCRVPRAYVKNADDDAELTDADLYPILLSTILGVPWASEETFTMACGIGISEGQPLPSPLTVLNKVKRNDDGTFHETGLADLRDYLTCLPKSLAPQVLGALRLMTLAPLPAADDPTAAT